MLPASSVGVPTVSLAPVVPIKQTIRLPGVVGAAKVATVFPVVAVGLAVCTRAMATLVQCFYGVVETLDGVGCVSGSRPNNR